jgi:DNA-binding transcriptional regulator YiaG
MNVRCAPQRALVGTVDMEGKVPPLRPLPSVPHDHDARLKRLRSRLRLTQNDLARRLRAANKVSAWRRIGMDP